MTNADASRSNRREEEQRTIEHCETEPVHDVGTVQPFGWLLATSADVALEVTHISENARDLAGIDVDDALSGAATSILDNRLVHGIRNVLGHSSIAERREVVGDVTFDHSPTPFEVSPHTVGDTTLVEFQQVQPDSVTTSM